MLIAKVRMEACMEREETRYVEKTKLLKEQDLELEKKMCQEFNRTYGRCLHHDHSCKKRDTFI